MATGMVDPGREITDRLRARQAHRRSRVEGQFLPFTNLGRGLSGFFHIMHRLVHHQPLGPGRLGSEFEGEGEAVAQLECGGLEG